MKISEIIFLISIMLMTVYSYFSLFLVLYGLRKKNFSKKNIKNNYPKISIIIPLKNEPKSIIQALIENLKSLKYRKDRVELVIVDDTSTDWKENKKIFEQLSQVYKVKYIHRSSSRGFKPGALNDALKASTGEIIACIDVDSRLPKNSLIEAAILLDDTDIDYIQYVTRPMIENNVSRGYSIYIEFRNNIYQPALDNIRKPLIIGYGFFVKKKVLEELKGWREDVLAEDLDLSVRLGMKGYKGKLIIDNLVLEKAPMTYSSLRKQQERWIFGAFQTFIDVLRRYRKFNDKKMWFVYILLTSMFLGLISNLIISLIPIFSYLLNEDINKNLFLFLTSINNVAFGIVGIKIFLSLLRYQGLKDIIVGFIISGILYNSLSLKALILFIKALFKKSMEWSVTVKALPRGRGGNFDNIIVFTALIYGLGFVFSLFRSKILMIWTFSLLISSLISIFYEFSRG